MRGFAGLERQRTRRFGPLLTRDPRRYLCQSSLLVVNGPTIRPLPAMSAAQEDGARRAGDAEFMASREVAVQPVPHVSLCSEVRDLFYRKASAAHCDDAVRTASCIFYEENESKLSATVVCRPRGTFCLANKFGTRDYGFRTPAERNLSSVGGRSFDRKNT